MFRVDTKNGYKIFAQEDDANNYKDFLENGLKIVRRSCGGWLFNDGSILFEIKVRGCIDKKYFLKKDNRDITSERLYKKYVEVLKMQ